MQYRFLFIALCAAIILSSCGSGSNTSHQESSTAVTADTATHGINHAERSLPPGGDNDPLVTNARKMIRGVWVDESDPKSVLIFTGDKQVSIYDGKADTVRYEISSHNCAAVAPEHPRPDKLYLKTDECYAIDTVDQVTLRFMYPDRGNMLVYKRKK